MSIKDIKAYCAEFIGTAGLVILGCGSAVAANSVLSMVGFAVPLAFSTLLIAVAFGLAVVAFAYAIGHVSGCHINPAVSFGMLLTGRMALVDFLCYAAAQFLGGIAGAGVLWAIFGSNASLGQNGYGEASALGAGLQGAFLAEALLTFIFVLTVLTITDREEYSSVAGLVIGLTLTVVHILGIPLTGTSVNPARSFGPALLAGGAALQQVWVFIAAPLVGAALAALAYRVVTRQAEE